VYPRKMAIQQGGVFLLAFTFVSDYPSSRVLLCDVAV
jgi:hypothetical protein